MIYSILAIPISFLVFYLFFKHNRSSIIDGLLFNIFILSIAILISILAIQYEFIIFRILLAILIAAYVIIFIFGIYILAIFLLFNSRLVYKRESRTLGNSLTLLLALTIILLLLISIFIDINSLHPILKVIFQISQVMIVYTIFHSYLFISSLFLATLSKAKFNQDYIIVLGSGLINGEVPALLRSRLDKAYDFYLKQKNLTFAPKIIVSGGQGDDEPRSEASAMKEYLLTRNVDVNDIIIEDQSFNTLQNLTNSKNIILKEKANYHCIFTTSDYHIFRANYLARSINLNGYGLKAKTALYYLPNAIIREYIAYLVIHKKAHIILFILIIIIIVAFSLIDHYNKLIQI